MTFAQYWAILLKQWKLIVLCIILVGGGAYEASKLVTPLYQSSALIQISFNSTTNQSDYNSLLAGDQLVQTEAQLATSQSVLRVVASHYRGMTLGELESEVTAAAKPNTQLFEIDVLDPSPRRAAELANDVANTLISQQLALAEQADLREQQQLEQDLNSAGKQVDPATIRAVLAQLELTQAQSEDLLRVVQTAQPPTGPSKPDTKLNTAIGLAAGLLLGILLALAYTQLDTRVRNAEALRNLTGWTVLATVFRSSAKERKSIDSARQNATSEAYRILRTNIGFAGVDKPLRTLLITSATPREGKSTIAANLAIFMAKAGKNTLLIDADLHRPVQHVRFNLPADKKGLSNAILAVSSNGSAGASDALSTSTESLSSISLGQFIHSVDIPHLWVMPSGPLPPNPSEMLESKSLQRLLAMILVSRIDMIIIDGPPALGLADANILAPKTDGTLLIVDITRARKNLLKQLKEVLAPTGARILGCVVNRQRRSRSDRSSYYYYYRAKPRRSEKVQSVNVQNGSSTPLTPLPATPLTPVEE